MAHFIKPSDRDSALKLIHSGTALWRGALPTLLPLSAALQILPMLLIAYLYRGMLGGITGSAWQYFTGAFASSQQLMSMADNAQFMTAINLTNLVINYVATPFMWAGAAHALCLSYAGRAPNLRFTVNTLTEYFKRILIVGIISTFALGILGIFVSLINAAGGIIVAITWWVPLIGIVLSGVMFVISLIAGLALSTVTLIGFMFIMCALMGESAVGSAIALRVWATISLGRPILSGTCVIVVANIALTALASGVCGLLAMVGLPWALALSLFFAAQALIGTWLAALAACLYKGAQGDEAECVIESEAYDVE